MRISASPRPCITALLAVCLALPALPTLAADKVKYYDIYLTDNRVCKKCAWRVIDATHVELVSSVNGRRGIYAPGEILGIDNHPLWRRFAYHMAHNSGIAGKAAVPEAFDRPDLPSSAHR